MSEQRKITVEKDVQIWQEHDREVLIELWHNAYETTALRLSPDEAAALLDYLRAYLEEAPA